MITEPKYEWIEDVCSPNDVLFINVGEDCICPSAIAWAIVNKRSIDETRRDAISLALNKVKEMLPDWEKWLIVSNKALQPDTKIVRHLGLWKSIERRSIKFNSGERTEETLVLTKNGLKFIGAIKWNDHEFDDVLALMREEYAIIALVPQMATNSSKNIIQNLQGYSGDNIVSKIIQSVCLENGVALSVFGEFDDPEIVVALISDKKNLTEFLSESSKK
ncbi:hypothetical protein HRH25_23170 [Flavisolibacter sp. BT320]|nr:hypothetical protein [Flavisolibacter longurius]